MAIDFSAIDKKKVLILGGAILSGLIALVLTNNYIKDNVDTKVSDIAGKAERQVRELSQQLAETQRVTQENIQKLFAAQQEQKQTVATPPAPKPAEPALSMNMPAGKRAVTVNIDILNAVGGLVKPGDFVDVIAHLTKTAGHLKPEESEKVTVMLFQNVMVLAVGRNTQPQSQPATPAVPTSGSVPITLALNPNEASLLTFVQKQGTLQLVLRPPREIDAFALPEASWESLSEYLKTTQGIDLFKKPEEKPEPAGEQERAPNIQIFKAGKEVTGK